MNRSIRQTEDGSKTIYVPELDEHYHSWHGAVQESLHVFIEMGLKPAQISKTNLHIFEMGLGTGLNLLLTLKEIKNIRLRYTTVEAYPVSLEEAEQMDYASEGDKTLFNAIHQADWNTDAALSETCTLHKIHTKLAEINLQDHPPIDLVYYDAFAPEKQPGLWTTEVFEKFYQAMNKGGILVTYCAKGAVKRAMKEAGFSIERLPGPPGKREMTRATKL